MLLNLTVPNWGVAHACRDNAGRERPGRRNFAATAAHRCNVRGRLRTGAWGTADEGKNGKAPRKGAGGPRTSDLFTTDAAAAKNVRLTLKYVSIPLNVFMLDSVLAALLLLYYWYCSQWWLLPHVVTVFANVQTLNDDNCHIHQGFKTSCIGSRTNNVTRWFVHKLRYILVATCVRLQSKPSLVFVLKFVVDCV